MDKNQYNFQIITPVWGDDYVYRFLNYLIPSLLSPSNLPLVSKSNNFQYVICCGADEQSIIESSHQYSWLKDLLPVVFVDVSDIISANLDKYQMLSKCLYLTLSQFDTNNTNEFILFLNPDLFVSDNFLNVIRTKTVDNINAIMMSGLRARADLVDHLLDNMRTERSIEIPSQVLSSIALDHLHPASEAFIWKGFHYPRYWCAQVFDRQLNGSFHQHCFHLHPSLLRKPEKIPNTIDTIDGDFLEYCDVDQNNTIVLNNDEDAIFIEVSGEPYSYPGETGAPSLRKLADFAVYHTSEIHWHFFNQRIIFNDHDKTNISSDLDCVVNYVNFHRPRRWLYRLFPRFERLIARHIFYVLSNFLTNERP